MNIITCLRALIPAAFVCLAAGAQAGNIPQYSFEETRNGFEFITDSIPVKVTYKETDEMVFPDKQTVVAYTAQGFPIGFDFRYAGKVFDQFAINTNGYIMLGNGKIEFKGYSNMFFNEASRYATNSFYMGLGPSMYSLKSGEISYKVEGTAGDRRLIVQFAHLEVNEPQTRGCATYSLQIELHEKDGKVQIRFIEEDSPYSVSLGMIAGIMGWNNDDVMLLTSRSLADTPEISPDHYASMIAPTSLLHWDNEDVLGDGHDEPYTFTLNFSPTGSPDFSCPAPADLNVTQRGDNITVSCKRPEGAPATAILISEKPILEFPEQGVSYPVLNDKEEYVTEFGDATLIYYNDGENPSAVFPHVKASTPYYVKAFGVNGYPYYSVDSSADLEFLSSHPAPYVLQATSGDKSINIKTIGDDTVIIAMTLDRVNTISEGATGIFGQPGDACQVGDEIEGGGKIIYIGDPGEFTYNDAEPNRQVFFRAWSIRDGRVSKTYISASGVTNPMLPYKPELELYSLFEAPLNWTCQTTSTDTKVTTNFVPRLRGENEDEPAVAGVSESSTATLISPAIPMGSSMKLRFEWSMETVRDFEDPAGSMVQLPEGNEPGVFGTGHSFDVYCGRRGLENELFKATEYTGSMTPSPASPDRYISGTSQFIPVEVEIPGELNDTSVRFVFRFSTEKSSILYLRNIMVEGVTGCEKIMGGDASDMILGGKGSLTVFSVKGGEYGIYSVDGRKVRNVTVSEGELVAISLERGIYVVNGEKVAVK